MHGEGDGDKNDDIDALRAEVEVLRGRLGETDQRTSEVIARLAHELRTPLGAILMWSHVLRLGRDADRDAALDAIETSVRAESKIIGRLLDVTRGMAGRLKISRGPLDLAELLRLEIETHRKDAEARGVRLEAATGDQSIWMEGDADRIREVVSNLVSNGIKFTASGGEVRVLLTDADDHARIVVSDTGPGLAAAGSADIFAPFRTSRDADLRAGAGLGLGLALARILVDLHGGTIRADSPGPGQGARFTVDLPLAASPID